MRRILICALLHSLVAAGICAQTSKKVGFLVAVRDSSKQQPAASMERPVKFKTLLIVMEGNQVGIVASTPGILVPRADGFWRVGVLPPQPLTRAEAIPLLNKRYGLNSDAPANEKLPYHERDISAQQAEGRWYEWKVWTAPLGKEPVLTFFPAEDLEELERFGGDREINLTWVGSDHISFVEQYSTYGPAINYVTHSMIVSIDEIAKNGYADFLGAPPWTPPDSPEVSEQIARDLERCAAEPAPEGSRDQVLLESASPSWGIVRGRTGWVLTWGLHHGSGVARGFGTSCPTSVKPPRSWFLPEKGSVPWNAVLMAAPDARTVFASPDGSVLLVMERDRIVAFRPNGRALGKPYAMLPIEWNGLVMAQWAVGSHVDRWSDEIRRATTIGLPKLVAYTSK